MEENIPMFAELPQTDPSTKKEKPEVNRLQRNLAALMKKRDVTPAMIQKETLIPWATLAGWLSYSVKVQMLDLNVKELADYFGITVDELAFGEILEDDEK